MVNGINMGGASGINPVQLLNAANAFKSAAAVKPQSAAAAAPEVSEGINLNASNSILKNVDVNEIKKYASMTGESNLSEDDIRYGLTYGRSVMADWVV